MKQVVVGMAGRKQSGKNTSYSCIRLWRPEAQDFSFAESLKRMAVDILGLEENQAFGTDEDKNTIVPHLLWDNFPIPAWNQQNSQAVFIGQPDNRHWPVTIESCHFIPSEVNFYNAVDEKFTNCTIDSVTCKEYDGDDAWDNGVKLRRKRGPMTAREVLQYWGTEIFRKQYADVWADACIRKIRKSGCRLAVITDCRFPNEVEAVQKAGGRVIKLTRVVFPEDRHHSETALDSENFDQSRFDAILDNSEMSIDEQCEALYSLLRRWGVVDSKGVHRIHV